MTKFDVAYYNAKYKFQWLWYAGGLGVGVTNALGALGIGVFIYSMWFAAYLHEP